MSMVFLAGNSDVKKWRRNKETGRAVPACLYASVYLFTGPVYNAVQPTEVMSTAAVEAEADGLASKATFMEDSFQ